MSEAIEVTDEESLLSAASTSLNSKVTILKCVCVCVRLTFSHCMFSLARFICVWYRWSVNIHKRWHPLLWKLCSRLVCLVRRWSLCSVSCCCRWSMPKQPPTSTWTIFVWCKSWAAPWKTQRWSRCVFSPLHLLCAAWHTSCVAAVCRFIHPYPSPDMRSLCLAL